MRFFLMTITILLGVLLCPCVMAQEAQVADSASAPALTADASYTADVAATVHGGLKRGTVYLGFLHAGVHLDLGRLGLLKGGALYVAAASTHGGMPSADYTGDMQVWDNIEAGNHTYLYQLWYRQRLGRWWLSAGIQDMNEHFMALDAAALYLNSSFGLNSVIAINDHPSTYPQMLTGLDLGWDLDDALTLAVGIYNGAAPSFAGNRWNMKQRVNVDNCCLLLGQASWQARASAVNAGVWYHTAEHDFGMWAMGQHRLLQDGRRTLDGFAAAACSPTKQEHVTANLLGGLNLGGLVVDRDMLGLAATAIRVAGQGWETALELNYNVPVAGELYVSPDVQYIVSPGASRQSKNALVLALRCGMSFSLSTRL